MKHSLKVIVDDHHICKRAHEAISALLQKGHSHDDISRLTGCTIKTLVESGSLNRSHFTALATHFQVSRLWLWTGLGPMIIDESKIPARII